MLMIVMIILVILVELCPRWVKSNSEWSDTCHLLHSIQSVGWRRALCTFLPLYWGSHHLFLASPSCSFKYIGQGRIIASDAGNNAPERPYDVFSIMIINFQLLWGSVIVIGADATLKSGHCCSSFPHGSLRMVDTTMNSQESCAPPADDIFSDVRWVFFSDW